MSDTGDMPHRLLRCRLHFASAILFAVTNVIAVAAESGSDGSPAEQHFAVRVWPVLQSKCFPCHGEGKELAGGLDLRSENTARQGGDSGAAAIVPGKRDESPLWRAISRRDAEFSAMPPKENDQLSLADRQAIGEWIATGASWPNDNRRKTILAKATEQVVGTVQVVTSGGLTPEWTNRRYKQEDLWAYRPLNRTVPPAAATGANAIDAFLSAKVAELGIQPSPRADRRTLLRRATYDLLGLPPSAEEVDQFLSDPLPDDVAFTHLVDRLLANPHYGEHWGRHWLDVTRYADSSGFANDFERGNAWRFRDYVVRAFNADLPFDQFVREQIAGDEIDGSNPELLIAVGFLRMGPWELTGMEVAKVARQRFLDDVTDIVGQVFLAHPLQCARCHDHKFDPLPTRDYYGMQAVFATTQLTERPAEFLPIENRSGFDERRFLEERQRRFQAILAELDKKEEAAARQWCAERGFEYVPRQAGLRRGIAEDRLPPKHAGFSVQDFGLERIARKGLERLRWEMDRYEPVALSVYSGPTPVLKPVLAPQRMPTTTGDGAVESTAILAGGDPFSPTIAVKPAALSVVENLGGPSGPKYLSSVAESVTGRRRALADWITHPRNPLTARVIANRVWQWHFGQAIAGNPNNFGATGKKPTHPELLDWLAASLTDRGWSLKSLHRAIMTSDAYQRSSDHPDRSGLTAKDPLGSSYAVFRPRRLSSEEIRDSMLAAAGELNLAIGGIPARPEINPEVALQPRQVMGTFAAAWQPSILPSQRNRRSLYILRIRGLRDPFADVFNEPSADLSCESRDVSTVTPQVFGLFNSRMSYDRAVAFAAQLRRENAEPREVIDQAFRSVFGRRAAEQEQIKCLAHWKKMTDHHREAHYERRKVPPKVVREAVEENTGERFEFVEELESAQEFTPDLQLGDVSPETRGLAELCLVLLNASEFVYVY